MKCKILLILLVFATNISAQNFSSSGLGGESLNNPTSLQFGPDDRLYVSQQNGTINAYTIVRNGSNNYDVTDTETINLVKNIPNHNDDGSAHASNQRQVTGILLRGTASNPILYVTSSDYRIGGGGSGSDQNLDTNSGMISKLTKNGNNWTKVDLVRGLPRSEENHATNGIQIDDATNTMYVAQGGHTNAGAPSNNFAFHTEYALSAAVLTVDLDAIESMSNKTDNGQVYKYDLPTVDDPTRSNSGGQDTNDPFGGNDGLNQAKLVPGGPVQIYAPGFRNIYDLVLTENGNLYTWDNGANAGWGGHPANEGGGNASNNWVSGEPGSTGPGPNDPQVNNQDGLHYITGEGYYGGHPNPIRANPNGAGLFTNDEPGGQNGVWRTNQTNNTSTTLPNDWPPVPNSQANSIEGDFQNAGEDDESLFTVSASTNGMAEYTASNFNGSLKGNLLAASFNENIYNVNLNNSGSINNNGDVSVFASNFGANPLDVIAQGDNDIFPGTVWAATYGANNITIFEPADYDDSGNPTIPNNPVDGDLYINVGGPAVNSNGNTWVADTYFLNGNAYSTNSAISGTSNDVIYQTERWNANLAYAIPANNGEIEVELHFADIFDGTHSEGARVFNVFIEGDLVLNNLDIFDEVGANAALVETFEVDVNDGVLNITMESIANNAKLSAIVIGCEVTETPETCTGNNSNSIDEDGDGFTNADEIDNNSDPCNGAIQPPDFDGSLINGFKVSNLNDPDDDDDGIPDDKDKFAWDATNGQSTGLPIDYPFLNGDPGFGFFGLGFTGLMTNNKDDYLELIKDEDNSNTEIIAGGAVGLFTINNVPNGDAVNNNNTQYNSYQFGIDVSSSTDPFLIESSILGPVFTSAPSGNQAVGIYIGNGDQDNYVKLTIYAGGGNPVIQVGVENNSSFSQNSYPVSNIGNVSELSLFFKVDPSTGTAQPQYNIGGGNAINVGNAISLSGPTLTALKSSSQSLAVGVISTTFNSNPDFSATWDYIKIDTDDNPNPSSSILSGPSSVTISGTEIIEFTNQSNNEDITIEDVDVNGNGFQFNTYVNLPYDLEPGEIFEVEVSYTGNGNQNGSLQIDHTGDNNTNVVLNGSGTPTIPGDCEGLTATYFNNINFTGSSITRVDPTIDFSWGNGSPDFLIGPNTFSVIWKGFVKAPSNGNYTFFTNTDDGVRLWVDGDLIIDQWNDQGPTEISATKQMDEGEQVSIKMEYYENGGGAVAQLSWQGSGVGKQIIPSSYLYPAGEVTTPPTPGNNDEFWLEAECANIGNAFTTLNDNDASEDGAVNYTGDSSTSNPPNDVSTNRIRFTVNVDEGSYKIYTRAFTPNKSSNSHWVRVNNGNWINYHHEPESDYKWEQVNNWTPGGSKVPVTFNLEDGNNTIDFYYRESGTILDKIYLTQGNAPANNSEGDNASNCSGQSKLANFDESYINIFPNPAREVISLQLSNIEKENVLVKIVDLLGKEHKVLELSLTNSSSNEISIEDLEEATYLVIVYVDDRTTLKQKLVVLK